MTAAIEKLPPHDRAAEEAVIASILVDPAAALEVLGSDLSPDDFFREQNRWIYESCLALFDRGEPISLVGVTHDLARRGKIDDTGGPAYLSRLTAELSTSIGAQHYARTIQRDATYRKLITAANHITHTAYAGGADLNAALTTAERLIASVRERVPADIIPIGTLPEPGPRRYLVDGLFQRDVISGVFGSQGIGKSYFGIDLGTAVPAGQCFLGRATAQMPAAIIDFEGLGKEEFTRRAYRIARGRGLERPPDGLHFIAASRSLLDSIGIIRSAVTQRQLGLIVIDSLSFAGVVDEATTIQTRRELATLPATIIVLDHQARVQRLEAYGDKNPYGSRFKEAAFSDLWQLELAETQPEGAIEMLMRDKKHRSGAHRGAIGLRLNFADNEVTLQAVDPMASVGLSTKLPADAQIEMALRSGPATSDQIVDETGLKKPTVKTNLSRMKLQGRVHDLPADGSNTPHHWVLAAHASTLPSTPEGRVDRCVDPYKGINAQRSQQPSTAINGINAESTQSSTQSPNGVVG